jgi:uncharacterized RDD family membrane protein YckC
VSDTSQGPGWWQASDGKWYPPEQAPGYQAPAGDVSGGTPGATGAVSSQWGTLADWPQRALGIVIDWAFLVVIWIVGYIIVVILSQISGALGALFFLVLWLFEVVSWLYMGYLVGVNGRSPGMALMGLKCVGDESGQIIGGGTGVIRSIAHIVDSIICYIGWLFPLWDTKRQTIADKIMKTVVLTDQPKASFSLELLKPNS